MVPRLKSIASHETKTGTVFTFGSDVKTLPKLGSAMIDGQKYEIIEADTIKTCCGPRHCALARKV